MAVMNRFAPVTESWKQTQPWVIFKYCFLSEGILFEQVSLLNTSLFLLPLVNRAVSRSAVSGLPQHSLILSFSPCWSLKLPLSLGSMRSRCLQRVVPQKSLLLRFTTLLWPGCCVSPSPISHGKWLQCFRCWKASSDIVQDHLPMAGGANTLPTNWRQKDKLFNAPHRSLCRVVVPCFAPW